MFLAYKQGAELPTLAWNANKSDDFFCPVCHEHVILRQGTIVCPHFAHYPDSTCIKSKEGGGGESARHDEMKTIMLKYLIDANGHSQNFGVEYKIGNRRADAFIELSSKVRKKGIAIECIHEGNKDLEDVIQKTKEYTQHGIATLWVADFSAGLNSVADLIGSSKVLQYFRQHWYYGRVYGLTKENELWAAHLDKTFRRKVYFLKITNFKAVPTKYMEKDSVQLVTFGEGTYWK